MRNSEIKETREECEDSEKWYNDGMNRAWEIAQKIIGMDNGMRCDMFDTGSIIKIFKYFSPREVEKRLVDGNEVFFVGDVVKDIYGDLCVVVDESGDGRYRVLYDNGNSIPYYSTCLSRTGRTIDVKSFLKQIKGENIE